MLMPHTDEQAILTRMLALRDGGLGPRRIARALNHEALQNPRTGAPWTFGQIQGILRTVVRRGAALAEAG